MTPAPLRCVLFDLDGTLIDTAPDLAYAANCVRVEEGLEPLPIQQYRAKASSGARGLLGEALGISAEHPHFPAWRDSFLAHYRRHLARSSRPFAGIAELLLQLELNGQTWGVVTNKAGWLARPLMQALGLAARAACVIGGDDVPRPKPAPDSLLLALQQIGVSAREAVYVGDDRRDIDAARAAGMLCVVAGWGYLDDAGTIESWGADAIARTPAELAALLAGE